MTVCEEIALLQSKLNSDKTIREEKYRLALKMLSNRLEVEIKQTLETSEIINKKIANKGFNKEEIEMCFKTYRQRKLEINRIKWENTKNSFVEEYTALRKEFDDLMTNKSTFIAKHGRDSFEAEKCKISQRMVKVELKRNCQYAHAALQSIEQKLEKLRQCENDLKAEIWSKFLKPIDKYFEAMKNPVNFGVYYTDWQIIGEFYQIQRNNNLPSSSSFGKSTKTDGTLLSFLRNTGRNRRKNENNQPETSSRMESKNMGSEKTEEQNTLIRKGGRQPKKWTVIKLVKRKKEIVEKDDPLPENSQKIEAAGYKNLDWTTNCSAWNGSDGENVPEANNEVTISTSPQSSALPVKVHQSSALSPPPVKVIKLDNLSDEKPDNLLGVSNKFADQLPTGSTIINAAGNVNCEFIAYRSSWNEMNDDDVPEADNEVTVSTSYQSEEKNDQSEASVMVKVKNMESEKKKRQHAEEPRNMCKIMKKIKTEEIVNEMSPFSTTSQIIKTSRGIDSEQSSYRSSRDKLDDIYAPGAIIEVKPPTLLQTTDVPVNIVKTSAISSPPSKIIKLENLLDEKPENLMIVFDQIAEQLPVDSQNSKETNMDIELTKKRTQSNDSLNDHVPEPNKDIAPPTLLQTSAIPVTIVKLEDLLDEKPTNIPLFSNKL